MDYDTTNAQLADALFVVHSTLKHRMRGLYNKFGCVGNGKLRREQLIEIIQREEG